MSEVMDLSSLYVRTKLAPGAEVVLLRDVERYPHFIAERGSRGIVVDAEERNVAVRMRERIPGAEEWDNEVQWFDGCGREDQTALAAAEADLGLCSACPTFPYWPRVPMSDDVVWVTGMGQMRQQVRLQRDERSNPVTETKTKQTFTLVEFFQTVQHDGATGAAYWEEPSMTDQEPRDVMIFDTAEDAADMARFILGADGAGDEREPRPDYAPLIGILQHDGDMRDLDDPECEGYSGWSYGWVDIDGVLHEGDYEDAPHWIDNPVRNEEVPS